MIKLKYIDIRPIYIKDLKHHKGGRSLPDGKDNIINVTETEARSLMKMRNGNKPCFEEVIESKPRRKETTNEDIDNGDR